MISERIFSRKESINAPVVKDTIGEMRAEFIPPWRKQEICSVKRDCVIIVTLEGRLFAVFQLQDSITAEPV